MLTPGEKETVGDSSYMEIDHADVDDGYRLFIKGAEFPLKGKPASPQVIANIAILKRGAMDAIKLLFLLPTILWNPTHYLTQLILSFNWFAKRLLRPHLQETRLLSPFSRELELLVFILLTELGIEDTRPIPFGDKFTLRFARFVSNIIEYDSAYRWRLQDLFSESSAASFFTWKELKRLEKIVFQRNDERVGKQSARILKILRYSLLIPRIRKALRKTIGMVNYERLCFDEGDRYWASFKLDYNFFGKTADERMQALKGKGHKIPAVQNS